MENQFCDDGVRNALMAVADLLEKIADRRKIPADHRSPVMTVTDLRDVASIIRNNLGDTLVLAGA